MCTCIHVMYEYVSYMCSSIYVCMHTCIYVSMHVCMYLCMYICMYISNYVYVRHTHILNE